MIKKIGIPKEVKKEKKATTNKSKTKTIKKEDVKKLQETFSHFFGASSDEIRKRSSKIRNKVYLFGFVATTFFALVLYLTKNIKFIVF